MAAARAAGPATTTRMKRTRLPDPSGTAGASPTRGRRCSCRTMGTTGVLLARTRTGVRRAATRQWSLRRVRRTRNGKVREGLCCLCLRPRVRVSPQCAVHRPPLCWCTSSHSRTCEMQRSSSPLSRVACTVAASPPSASSPSTVCVSSRTARVPPGQSARALALALHPGRDNSREEGGELGPWASKGRRPASRPPTAGTAGPPTAGTAGLPTAGTAGPPTAGTAGPPTAGTAGSVMAPQSHAAPHRPRRDSTCRSFAFMFAPQCLRRMGLSPPGSLGDAVVAAPAAVTAAAFTDAVAAVTVLLLSLLSLLLLLRILTQRFLLLLLSVCVQARAALGTPTPDPRCTLSRCPPYPT